MGANGEDAFGITVLQAHSLNRSLADDLFGGRATYNFDSSTGLYSGQSISRVRLLSVSFSNNDASNFYGYLSGRARVRGYSFIQAAVPEPETYAMLLAGLGLIGYTARRRRMV